MEIKKAVATALLLLLQLMICCDAQTSHYLCEGDTCHVSPNNFSSLQEIIHSNQNIILDGDIFNVDGSNGVIAFENVSNLTISGGDSDSVLECSQTSAFGFHLKNVTNITFTRMRIKNCGSHFPNYLKEFINSSYDSVFYSICQIIFCQTSILIETSINVNLRRVHIEHSPGLALTVINYHDENSEDPSFSKDNMNPNLRLTDCTISNSRQGSVMMIGKESLLIETIVIANSSTGITSYNMSNIIMKNVQLLNCTNTDLVGGYAIVKEKLVMNRSSLYVKDNNLQMSSSFILFCSKNTNEDLVHGYLFLVVESSCMVLNRSTLIFTNHEIFYFNVFNSVFNVVNKSSLVFSNNSVENDQCSVP